MAHHLDFSVRGGGLLHRLDPRAKMIAAAGFIAAVLLAPMHPPWCIGALLLLLSSAAALARLPMQLAGRRLLSLAVIIGVPFLLSRLGNEQTRAAGEQFAAKSLLIAAACLVLLASTRALALLEVAERLPLMSAFGQLGGFILRGVDVLVDEVVRTNRAWRLRAPRAPLRMRLAALTHASMSLIGRAAVRSERVGAAMVLRGYRRELPAASSAPVPLLHGAAGVAYACACIGLAGMARWL